MVLLVRNLERIYVVGYNRINLTTPPFGIVLDQQQCLGADPKSQRNLTVVPVRSSEVSPK